MMSNFFNTKQTPEPLLNTKKRKKKKQHMISYDEIIDEFLEEMDKLSKQYYETVSSDILTLVHLQLVSTRYECANFIDDLDTINNSIFIKNLLKLCLTTKKSDEPNDHNLNILFSKDLIYEMQMMEQFELMKIIEDTLISLNRIIDFPFIITLFLKHNLISRDIIKDWNSGGIDNFFSEDEKKVYNELKLLYN